MQNIGNVNFDHPQIFDWDLLKITLQQLSEGKDVLLPDYDYKTCKRRK
jgi:uridine kinase